MVQDRTQKVATLKRTVRTLMLKAPAQEQQQQQMARTPRVVVMQRTLMHMRRAAELTPKDLVLTQRDLILMLRRMDWVLMQKVEEVMLRQRLHMPKVIKPTQSGVLHTLKDTKQTPKVPTRILKAIRLKLRLAQMAPMLKE